MFRVGPHETRKVHAAIQFGIADEKDGHLDDVAKTKAEFFERCCHTPENAVCLHFGVAIVFSTATFGVAICRARKRAAVIDQDGIRRYFDCLGNRERRVVGQWVARYVCIGAGAAEKQQSDQGGFTHGTYPYW